MERRCARCNEMKNEDEFAGPSKSKSVKDCYCRPCRAAYKQEHYKKNRQRYIDKAKERQRLQIEERMIFSNDFLRITPVLIAERAMLLCWSSIMSRRRASI